MSLRPLALLDVEGDQRLQNIRIIRVQRMSPAQRLFDGLQPLQVLQHQTMIVVHPRPLRHQHRGLAQRLGGLGQPLLLGQQQTQRVFTFTDSVDIGRSTAACIT